MPGSIAIKLKELYELRAVHSQLFLNLILKPQWHNSLVMNETIKLHSPMKKQS